MPVLLEQMDFLLNLAKIFLIGVALFAFWVRLAPSATATWHVDPWAVDQPAGRGYLAQANFDVAAQAVLLRLDAVALGTPRTRLLAGDVRQGKMTYITRSLIWGFPDYTTVAAQDIPGGSRLTLYGRLRFGISDGGVNRARIKTWLQRMQAIDD